MKLTEGFNLLATAPDGIKRLRELILSLAVQGKLVPQDPSDQPASELLKQIRAEKDRLIAEGKIKKDKPLLAITDEEKPFELPMGWEWTRQIDLLEVLNGRAYGKNELLEQGMPVLRVGNLFTSNHWYYSDLVLEEDKYCDKDDLIFAWSASFGPFLWQGPKVIYHYHIWKLRLHSELLLDKKYLYTFLLEKTQELKAGGHGVSMVHMTKDNMEKTWVPVPPLAEQSRIVAKVEELMALCDALESRGVLESKQHAQLTATLFDALAASVSAHQLQENWTRLASSFDLILDRPEAVDALEQTLLQLAVRGLLVEQDPNDQPASELLKQIRAEKDRLIAEGKIKGDKPEAASFDDAPYELPEKWEWTTIGEIISSMGSGWSPACLAEPQATPDQWAVLKTTAVQLMEYQAKQNKLLPSILEPRPEIEAQNGDILITRAGPRNRVGISCLVQNTPPKLMISDKIVRFHVLGKLINPQFVVLCLNAGWSYQRLDAAKSGMAESQVNISQGDLRAIPLPLCTLAEQTRIVARVEALRTLCADLRARLAASQKIQTHLAETLVAGCV
jgi:type I restriction enzyme S subunit